MDRETHEMDQAFEDAGRLVLSLAVCALALVTMLALVVFL